MFSYDVIVIIARNKYLVYILINAKSLYIFFREYIYGRQLSLCICYKNGILINTIKCSLFTR